MRPRTLVALFVVSSVATIGLRAAGVFGRGHDDAHRLAQSFGITVDQDQPAIVVNRSQSLPVVLARTTAEGDEFTWSGLPTAKEIEIRSLLGSITVEHAAGDSVRVVAMRTGDGRDAVQVRVLDRGERLTVCAAHPSAREDNSSTVGCGTAVPSSNGRKQMRGDARVNFTVQLPDGFRVVARAVDGKVMARGLGNDLEVSTVNGDVSIQTTGAAEAKTMNGNIDAQVGRMADADNRFETLHGNVTVLLPGDVGAAVRAESVTGQIQTDLPIQVSEVKRSKLIGTLNAGGPALVVKTVAGEVAIRKAP